MLTTFLVLFLGDYSHGHAGWRGEFPSTRQAADLQWTEVALQGVLQSHVSLLSFFLLFRALPRPVIHLEPHHFTARTRRTTKGKQEKSETPQRNVFIVHHSNQKAAQCMIEKACRGCRFILDNYVCFWRTQLLKGRWTQRETVEECPQSPSHTDQPMEALGRTGCLCWPPWHHLSPLQIGEKENIKHKF